MKRLLTRLVTELEHRGIELTPIEIAESLFLADRLAEGTNSYQHQIVIGDPTVPPQGIRAPRLFAPNTLQKDVIEQKNAHLPVADHDGETPQRRVPFVDMKEDAVRSNAIPIEVPVGAALPAPRAIARALRPLKRKYPSPSVLEFDESATVRAIAEEKLWRIAERPADERWLSVALVVDSSPSIILWDDVIREFERLLRVSGIFRNVERLSLDCAGPVTLHLGGMDNPRRSPRELVDPSGRRIFFVISDCVGRTWYDGGVARFLAPWANAGAVSLIQLLPPKLWQRTALASGRQVWLRADAQTNARRLTGVADEPWDHKNEIAPMPVLNLEPRWLANWARLIGRSSGAVARGVGLSLLDARGGPVATKAEKPIGVELLLSRFRQSASPRARQLASYLAVVPIWLPIVRLVREAMLPEATLSEEAEIFLSGLIVKHAGRADQYFDFVPGARENLGDSVSSSETVYLLSRVGDYIGARIRHPIDFMAWVAHPEAAASINTVSGAAGDFRVFAQVAAQALARLGGRYAALAEKIQAEQRKENQPRTKLDPLFGVALLWVDDHPKNNLSEREELEARGAFITLARSTGEGLENVAEHIFDGVISNLRRGRRPRDGLDFLQKLRNLGLRLPFAIYSTRAGDYAQVAKQEGAIVCTDDFTILCDEIGRVVRGGRARSTVSPPQFNRLHTALANLPEAQTILEALQRNPHRPDWSTVWRSLSNTSSVGSIVVLVIEAIAHTGYCQLWKVQNGRIVLVAKLIDPGKTDYEEASWEGLIGRAVKTKKVVHYADVTSASGYIPAEPSTQSEVVVPLLSHGHEQAIGAINIEAARFSAFSGHQIQWLEGLANSLTGWLEGDDDTRQREVSATWPTYGNSRQIVRINVGTATVGLGVLVSPYLVATVSEALTSIGTTENRREFTVQFVDGDRRIQAVPIRTWASEVVILRLASSQLDIEPLGLQLAIPKERQGVLLIADFNIEGYINKSSRERVSGPLYYVRINEEIPNRFIRDIFPGTPIFTSDEKTFIGVVLNNPHPMAPDDESSTRANFPMVTAGEILASLQRIEGTTLGEKASQATVSQVFTDVPPSDLQLMANAIAADYGTFTQETQDDGNLTLHAEFPRDAAPEQQPAQRTPESIAAAAAESGGGFNLDQIPPQHREMAKLILDSFAAAGLGKVQQAAALANACMESGLDPKRRITTEGEDSIGLFQLNRFGGAGAGHSAEELMDANANIAIVMKALQNISAFVTATTLQMAVDAFVRSFERPVAIPEKSAKQLEFAQGLLFDARSQTSHDPSRALASFERQKLRLKRIYEQPDPQDGIRILVDRLWPRGLSRTRAQIDLWLKEIAPSDALRRRFHGGAATGWENFKTAYYAELERKAAGVAVRELLNRLTQDRVTLLFAARDETHNNAVALKEWLDERARLEVSNLHSQRVIEKQVE